MSAIAFLAGPAGRLLGGLLLIGSLVLGVDLWLSHRDAAAYKRGHADAVAEWTADTARRQQIALAKQKDFQDRNAALAASMGVLAGQLTKENADARSKLAAVNADIAAGRMRLTVPGAICPGGGGASAAAGGTGVGDGGASAVLPPAIGADLAALADEADEVARQLGACQQILRAERAR